MKSKSLFYILFALAAYYPTIAQQGAPSVSAPVSARVLVDSLCRALDRIYIFPEKSKVMGDHLRAQLKKGIYKNITDPKQLAERLGGDLQVAHKDGHLRMHYDPGFSARAAEVAKNAAPPDMANALKQSKEENFSFKKLEILEGNVGYVEFTGFNGFIDEAKPTLAAAFRFVSNTHAIIIDLRRNGGGSPWMVKQIASYFYSERTRLNDIYERRRNKTMEFWAEPELAGNMKLAMPVYILTGKGTFSAAEDFTYAMQVNKRAVIVGDTTGGGAHPTGPVDVGQGFVVDIPFARSINHITKTDWEGIGVRPDVAVPADQALQKAHMLALEDQLAQATTEERKKQLAWILNTVKAHEYNNTLDNATLQQYAGEYAKFNITVKDSQLYLHNTETKRSFRLKPITQSLFLVDDWQQAEFVTRDNGITLKLLGKPGWEYTFEKTKK